MKRLEQVLDNRPEVDKMLSIESETVSKIFKSAMTQVPSNSY